jgi:hypothetical protein
MAKYRMLAKEVSPGRVVSGGGACPTTTCPAVLLRDDGNIVVIGKKMAVTEIKNLESTGMVKVYDDEQAIVIDPQLIIGANKELV